MHGRRTSGLNGTPAGGEHAGHSAVARLPARKFHKAGRKNIFIFFGGDSVTCGLAKPQKSSGFSG